MKALAFASLVSEDSFLSLLSCTAFSDRNESATNRVGIYAGPSGMIERFTASRIKREPRQSPFVRLQMPAIGSEILLGPPGLALDAIQSTEGPGFLDSISIPKLNQFLLNRLREQF